MDSKAVNCSDLQNSFILPLPSAADVLRQSATSAIPITKDQDCTLCPYKSIQMRCKHVLIIRFEGCFFWTIASFHDRCNCSEKKKVLGSLIRAFSKIFFLFDPIVLLFQNFCCNFTDIVTLLLLGIASDPFAGIVARYMQQVLKMETVSLDVSMLSVSSW